MSAQPEALRLADELEAPVGTQSTYSVMQQAAAELRRLQAEYETLKKSVATAWNRGHTMGMRANEDIARQALEVVKKDAWANTQLTEALLKAEEQCDALMEANEAFSKREHWWNEKMFTLEQQRDALLEALKEHEPKGGGNLPPPLQAEPVAVHQFRKQYCANWYDGHPDHTDGGGPYEERTLYTAPPRREWQGLTEEEMDCWTPEIHPVIRAVEAKLKEKNA
jgi:hypothetical protein